MNFIEFFIEFYSVNHPSFPLSLPTTSLLSSLSPPSFFIVLPFFLHHSSFLSSSFFPSFLHHPSTLLSPSLPLPLSLPLHQVTAQLADVSQKAFSFLSSTVQVLGEKVSQVKINIVFVYQSFCCVVLLCEQNSITCMIFFIIYNKKLTFFVNFCHNCYL